MAITKEKLELLEKQPVVNDIPIINSYISALKEALNIQSEMKPEEQRIVEKMLTTISEEPTSSRENTEDYLSVRDVSKLLGISPQMVRRHCVKEKIIAWRTLGETGEWRIDIDQYKTNPRLATILKEKQDKKDRKEQLIETVKELSEHEGYIELFDDMDARKGKRND